MSQNAITDDSSPTELPQTQVDKQELVAEKNMAKFSKSQEFKTLKEHLEQRIEFYQQYLPDGRPVNAAPVSASDWVIANAIVGEFKAVLAAYENANQVVNNAN